MPPFVLLFLVSFINFSIAQSSPEISFITPDLITDVNEDVKLSCTVQHSSEHPIMWLRVENNPNPDSLFISTGRTLILRDWRYSLNYDQESSTYVLGIKNIQETDAGNYQCQILISPDNRVFAEVKLQVRRPPSISKNSTKSVVISEGQDVQMECYAEGFPPPEILWRRENNDLLPTGNSIYKGNILKIQQIRKEDRGTYFCVAQNGVGRAIKQTIPLHVEFAPVVTVPSSRLGQALQFDMDLGCHVEAYPQPEMIWEKDNRTLLNNQHYSISNFATSDEFYETFIRAISIEKEQYGQYTCKAANKLGRAEKVIELFETDQPICPPACATTTSTTTISPNTTVTTINALTKSNSSQSNDHDPENS